MFKKISVDFPEFGVKTEHQFKEGFNLIEEPNGYGKTTVLKTILSLWTGKFGTVKIPNGTASIETEDSTYLLSKGMWVGKSEDPVPLAKYAMSWAFFDLSTPDQRLAIVDLLGIDYEGYMKKAVPQWHPKIETELNAKLKFNEGKESALLEDIQQLRSAIIAYDNSPETWEDNSQEVERLYHEKFVREFEKRRFEALEENAKMKMDWNKSRQELSDLMRKRDQLRDKFNQVKTWTCPTCWSPNKNTESLLAEINAEGKVLNVRIAELNQEKEPNYLVIPDPMEPISLESKAKALGMELKRISPESSSRTADYMAAKKQLVEKENQLKSLGEIEDAKTLEAVKDAKRSFTENLNVKVKDLGLEIELFKTQKNWDVVESFVISYEWIPYAELSNGFRVLLQFKVACVFARCLRLPTVLVDEAGTLSGENLKRMKEASQGLQVLMARATPFAKKDFTK